MRCCLLLLHLGAVVVLHGQDRAILDSLATVVAAHPDYGDTVRIYAIINQWRETRSSDLELAEGFAHQLIREGRVSGNEEALATGYQRLAITKGQRGEKDSSYYYNWLALDSYNRRDVVSLQGVMLYNIGVEHMEAGRPDSALHYLEQAGERFARDGNAQREGAVLIARGQIKREQSLAAEALELSLAARALFVEAGDVSRMADADQEIAFAYETLDDYATALEYHRRAYAAFQATREEYYASISQLNIGGSHAELGQLDSSRYHLEAALETIRREDFVELEAEALLMLGDIEHRFGDPDRAVDYFGQALPLTAGPEQLADRTRVAARYASLLAERGRVERAEALGREAVTLSYRTGLREYRATALGALSRAAEGRGDLRTALTRERAYRRLQDSIHREETTAVLAEMQARYETERQGRLIEQQRARLIRLEQERAIEELRSRNLWITLVGTLLFFGAIGYSLYQRLRRSRSERAAMQERVRNQQRELSTHTLHLVQKNQMLEQLHREISAVSDRNPDQSLNRILHSIQNEELVDQDWVHFKTYFQEVHGDYEERLRAVATTTLSPRELRLAALIKMGLNNAEVGTILNVSQESLYKAKYRLRKKLPAGEGENLDEFLQRV